MLAIQSNVNLKPFNTFGFSVHTDSLLEVESMETLKMLLNDPTFEQPRFILGGGSNILFTQNFHGLVIKMVIKGIEVIQENEEHIWLRVGAGEVWHDFVMYCVSHNYGGVENLSLIPGTVGASPIQNIGAYGVEVKETIDTVEAIDLTTGSYCTFSNADCVFGYRDSVFKQRAFKGKYIITHVVFKLTKHNHKFVINYGAIKDLLNQSPDQPLSIKAISDVVIHIRKSKLPDPAVIGNAGSFFKNPTISKSQYEVLQKEFPAMPSYPVDEHHVKVPAGWLIEQCGWKGKTFDAIGVHKQQALVLVNYGGGKGHEVWQLAQRILSSVKDKFNIELHPEVNIL
jgi:UDP-N-acetylmuramate dehydrogenase